MNNVNSINGLFKNTDNRSVYTDQIASRECDIKFKETWEKWS
jgi:hypothetical protein